ncbi:MAG: sugar transferase, partial [Bacteroidia bacterium]|nr:sugar transferase [Bacteroidia bacterium]
MAAVLVWLLLFWFRKQFVDTALIDYQIPIEKDQKLIVGLMMIPLFWVIFYYFTGFYRNIYRRSRLTELKNTFYTSFAGSLFIFFAVLLDDSVADYKGYYYTFSVLFILQLVITYIFRFILSSRTNKRIQNREIGFNTVIVGSNERAYKLYRELEDSKISNGFFFKGFVNVNGEDNSSLKQHLPHLGSYKNLKDIIHEYSIEEVVIALETTEHDKLNDVFAKLENEKVFLKIIPDLYSIFTRMVKMNNILGAVLIEVDFEVMPEWQKNFKRIFDIMFSIFILLVLSPFLLLIAMAVKLSGKGPVFYTQERIGMLGKPFRIIKFRSMKVDAETAGP